MNRKKYVSYQREKANSLVSRPLWDTPTLPIFSDRERKQFKVQLWYFSHDRSWYNKEMDTYLMMASMREYYECVKHCKGFRLTGDRRRYKRMLRHYGKPCGQHYHPGCVACAGWGMYLFYQKFPLPSRVLDYVSSLDEMVFGEEVDLLKNFEQEYA